MLVHLGIRTKGKLGMGTRLAWGTGNCCNTIGLRGKSDEYID